MSVRACGCLLSEWCTCAESELRARLAQAEKERDEARALGQEQQAMAGAVAYDAMKTRAERAETAAAALRAGLALTGAEVERLLADREASLLRAVEVTYRECWGDLPVILCDADVREIHRIAALVKETK